MTVTATCDPVLCHGDADGYIEGRVYGGTPPYTVTISGPMTVTTTVNEYSGTFDFSGLIAGTYTVTAWGANYDYKNNTGCSAATTALIGEPPLLEWDVNCAIDSLGIVSGTVNGGTAPYRVILQQADDQASQTVANSGGSFTFDGLQGGDYKLTVRDANYLTNLGAGCTLSRDLTISMAYECPDSIWITTNPTPPEICRGDIITLIAQSNTNCTNCVYEWSTGHKGRWTTVCPDSTTTYTVTVMTPDSCLCIGTDTAMVTVVVRDTFNIEIDTTICAGDSYTLGGQTLTEAGTYTEVLMTASGCDSTVTVNLSVLPEFNETIDAEICEGDSYTFNGQVLTTAGTYSETFTASNGCDSTVTLYLTVLPEVNETIDASICEGDSYTFGGQVLTTTGTYTETFTASNGCDSTVTLNLTVLPEVNETIDASICEGDSYTFGGQVLTTTGTYTETFTASNGCDSTVTLYLTLLPEFNETIDASICEGDSYTFGGQVLTTTGTYTEIFTASNGCDSTVTLNLTVLPEFNETIDAEICEGDSYTFGGQVLTTTGTYPETFTASNGCDSTVTLILTVLPEFNETIDASICEGDSYTFGGQVLTTAGTYSETFTASNGCDSTVTLILTVLPEFNETIDASICEGDSYTFGGQVLTTAGTYSETFTASNGCDSTVTLYLTVLPEFNETIDAAICEGDSYTFGGQVLTTAGTYSETLTASNGCDSTVTLILTVLPEFNETIDASICEGDSYTFNGQVLTTAGTYSETFTASNGCDSTVTLYLTVLPEFNETIDASICEGDSYTFGGQVLTTAGTYSETLTASNGCDSTVTLILTVLPEFNETIDASICEGDSYTFNGQVLTTAGTYSETFTASNGCDSTVTLILTVLPEFNETIDAEICEGDSYTFGGQVLTTAGTYSETFTASNGCDSTVTLYLTVLPEFNETIDASICEGDTYTFGGQVLTDPGTYMENFTASNGCDSTVTLNLTVLPEFNETIDASICEGDSYTFGGQVLTDPGTYMETFTASNGCDSTVTLYLTVTDSIKVNEEVTICKGDKILFNDQYITDPGVYLDTIPAEIGCDTIVCLTVIVTDPININEEASICPGDSILFNDRYITQAGVYCDTIPADVGCDTIICLTVTELDEIEVNQTADICPGDSILFNGQYISQAGVYCYTIPADVGCDTTFCLTVNELDSIKINQTADICPGDSILFNGQYITQAGVYCYSIPAEVGCDTMVCLTVTELDEIEVNQTADICPGDSILFNGQYISQAGVYCYTIPAEVGCDTTFCLTVNELDSIKINQTADICPGDSILFNGQYITQAGVYCYSIPAEVGCDTMVCLTVTELDEIEVNQTADICPGDSILFNGQYISQAGVYCYTIPAEVGCDTTFCLTVNELDSIKINQTADICPGDSILFNGQYITQAGVYCYSIPAEVGCDTMVCLTVTELDEIEVNQTADICPGDSILFNGQYISQAGVYCYSIPAEVGCDTTVCLTVTEIDEIEVNQTADICPGDSILFNGQYITQAGVYCDTIRVEVGCDTILCLTVNEIDSIKVDQTAGICPGDSILFNGQYITQAGVYSYTIPAEEGCDTTVCLTVTEIDEIKVDREETICRGDSILFNDQYIFDPGVYCDTIPAEVGCDTILCLTVIVTDTIKVNETATICEGESYPFNGQDLTESGVYLDTIPVEGSCDTIICLTLMVNPRPDAMIIPMDSTFCEIPDDFTLTVINKDTTQTLSYEWEPDFAILAYSADSSSVTVDIMESTCFSVYLTNQYGCRDTLSVCFPPPPCPETITVTADRPLPICPGETVTLTASSDCADCTYEWTIPGGAPITGPSITVNPSVTTTYTVVAITPEGCICEPGTDFPVVVDCPCETDGIFVPSAFTPNGDGTNDIFCVRVPNGVDDEELIVILTIYDRWGEVIFFFDSTPYVDQGIAYKDIPDDVKCWDGTYKGAALAQDVYVYSLDLECKDTPGTYIRKVGDVILLR